jgi:hypothetical protein
VTGGECLDSPDEALDEVFTAASRRLARDCLYDAEQILGAKIDLAQAHLLFASLLCQILSDGDKDASPIAIELPGGI